MDNYRFAFKDENLFVAGEILENRLINYHNIKNNIEGNIYRARVLTFLKSMDAYILDIGEYKKALLRKKFVVSEIKNGMEVIVEVIKVPEGDKLIEVSEKITLSDGYIVISPYFKSESKNIINQFDIPILLRTRGKTLEREEILIRYKELEMQLKNIQKEKNYLPTPKLLRQQRFLQNYIYDYEGEFISNFKYDKVTYNEEFNPKFNKIISFDLSKSKLRNININDSNITIDRLDTLTVIDVNSGNKYINLEKEEMSLRVNLSVLREIVIQISLRQIKKMIIIDFIRVNSDNQHIIIKGLIEEFKKLKIHYKIIGFTKMGLLELIIY